MPDPTPISHLFGGGAGASMMPPAILALYLILALEILDITRNFLIIPFLSGAFLVWLTAQFYIAGVHWLVLRLLILLTLVRFAFFRPKEGDDPSRITGGLNELDRAFLYSALAQAICVVLLFWQGDALVNQAGFLIDFVGGYFAIRFLIRDRSDLYRAFKWLAVLSFVLAVGMVIEQIKLVNVFALLAGVVKAPDVREGKIRSQGVFQHAIPAGTVAATWIPLFFLLYRNGKSKLLATIGLISSAIMVYTSQSSTPLLAFGASFLALSLWFVRDKMRAVRWGLVLSILVLAAVMKAPVWYAIAHIDLTGGSSGYHRAFLVDQFIRHFWDWWLIGVRDTASWGWDLWDVQNQYIAVGETGGLVAFGFFIALVTRGYVRLGKARNKVAGDKGEEWIFWFLASSLFANTLAFIGVNYFDQSRISWFLILAAISTTTTLALKEPSAEIASASSAIRPGSPRPLTSLVERGAPAVRWRQPI